MLNINIKNLFAKQYKTISILLAFLVLILGYFWALEDKWQGFRKIQTSLLPNTETEFTVTEQSYLRLKKQTSNFDIIVNERISKLKEILPDKKDLPVLYLQMFKVVENLGLEIENLKIAESVSASDSSLAIREVQIDLELKEPLDYISLKSLLGRIYYVSPLFNVKSINLNGSFSALENKSQSGGKKSNESSLTFYTYYVDTF